MATFSLNGDYVDASVDVDSPYAPITLVTDRFNATLAMAEEVYERLAGDGTTTFGYLGDMQSAIDSAPTITITPVTVDTSLTLATSGQTLPTFDSESLQDYPTDTYTAPTMATLPSVDTDFDDVTEPTDVVVSLTWSEATLPTTLFTAIMTRLTADLASGATGLDSTVEAAIYSRARTRQAADRLAEYNRIGNAATQMQFQFPSGVLASALTDFGIGANRQDADIENQIIVMQGDLAQKNSQFTMQQAIILEQSLRQTRSDESNRALDAAKYLLGVKAEDFRNRVQKFVAIWEGRKVKVQAQVEALRGVIESNKGLIEIFKAQYDALKTRIDAVSSHNKGLTDVYIAEVQGYGEAEKAVASINESSIKLLAEEIKNADIALRADIAEAEQTMAGYSAEMALRDRMATSLTQLSSGLCASIISAVHAGATVGYSGGESSNKSVHLSASLGESHSVEHDPAI